MLQSLATGERRGWMDVVAGLLLAAGAGRRMGMPKALVRDPGGEAWVARSARTLVVGGCAPVLVVLGARAAEAAPLVPPGLQAVVAQDWAEGISASLRAGLRALGEVAGPHVVATVVGLVDTPGVNGSVVARIVARAQDPAVGAEILARAAYRGVPGHPVLLGRAHWAGVIEQVRGDTGARGYLVARQVVQVECADLGDGRDVDG
jgi:CTP:molybdopterin cytidylyltransferase MocA